MTFEALESWALNAIRHPFFGLSHFVILGTTRSVGEAHFPNWRLVHVDEGLVSSPETILWMIQWCALVVMGASWDTSTTAISASPPSSCALASQPSGEQCGCSGGVYPQDAASDSGLGAALAAHPPLRSGLHALEREAEGAKICGADVLVSKSPRCDMADVGCGCGVSLGHLALR